MTDGIKIYSRWDSLRVLYTGAEGVTSLRAVLEAAKMEGANLDGANLDGAYLDGAYLDGAYLCGANLDGAYLDGAYLRGANLGGANLGGAYLGGAYLRGANLGGANLGGAYLGGANLGGANLGGAYLRGACLRGAYLDGAYLRGAKIAWTSHDLVAEILRRNAGGAIERHMVAGLILIRRDWCWEQFLALERPEREWALDTLAAHVVDGDNAPAVLRERAAKMRAVTPQRSACGPMEG